MRREDFTLPDPPAIDRPGDRWECGVGGSSPCSRGPDANGRCPLSDSCHPRRTWHGRRKQLSLLTSLAVVLLVFVVAYSKREAEVFKPGDLATPHAQILAGTLASERCAACHGEAAESPLQWMWSSDSDHPPLTQSDRCLDCHHRTMDRSTAMFAHNLPRQTREAIRLASTKDVHAAQEEHSSWNQWLPGPAVDQDNVACGACHREHHGATGDLLNVSDSQCQTCHSRRFGSFATSHPNWGRWPYGRGGDISFDHASHAGKHYPATIHDGAAAKFQCSDCHPRGSDGELMRSTSFEHACAGCHEAPLALETIAGVELLSLPSLETESAERIPEWPSAATGFYDGKVAPLADLLIRGDESVAAALREIPQQDFSRIAIEDHPSVQAAETIAVAHERLLKEIATGGQSVLVDRTLRMGVKRDTVLSLVRTISPQLVQEASKRWFRSDESSDNVSSDSSLPTPGVDPSKSDRLDGDLLDGDDLLGESLLGSDPLAGDPLAEPLRLDADEIGGDLSPSFDVDQMLPAGGWYVDDERLSIRYRGSGHDDPVLKSVVEMISQLPPADRSRQALLQTPAVAACVECHPGAVSVRPTWVSRPLVGRRDQLTKYSHRSHLNVAQLSDCRHCHRIESANATNVRLVGAAKMMREFAPLSKQACVACHVPKAAGDNCTTCHRYHVR